jgi:hypothetical protein
MLWAMSIVLSCVLYTHGWSVGWLAVYMIASNVLLLFQSRFLCSHSPNSLSFYVLLYRVAGATYFYVQL